MEVSEHVSEVEDVAENFKLLKSVTVVTVVTVVYCDMNTGSLAGSLVFQMYGMLLMTHVHLQWMLLHHATEACS